MEIYTLSKAALLGLIEGITEYLPVSSTAHLLLAGLVLDFNFPGKTFEVMIQLGAILALLTVYAHRIINIATAFPHDPRARYFMLGVIIAFLPAALIGITMYKFIKQFMFEATWLICLLLIIGGIVLLWLDKLEIKAKYHDIMDYPLSLCLKIGLFQSLALMPGTSRSGATIVGALLFGADKKSATEFSFFLAIPTMLGAFIYDFYKNYHLLTSDNSLTIAVGFVFAFLSGMVIVKKLVDFVTRHGFAFFAYWRIIVGCLGLLWLYFYG